MAKTVTVEIRIGTEHWRSDVLNENGRVARAKLKLDLVWLGRESEAI